MPSEIACKEINTQETKTAIKNIKCKPRKKRSFSKYHVKYETKTDEVWKIQFT